MDCTPFLTSTAHASTLLQCVLKYLVVQVLASEKEALVAQLGNAVKQSSTAGNEHSAMHTSELPDAAQHAAAAAAERPHRSAGNQVLLAS